MWFYNKKYLLFQNNLKKGKINGFKLNDLLCGYTMSANNYLCISNYISSFLDKQ